MRELILMLALAFSFAPAFVQAQSNSGTSEDMTKMLEQAMKAQACMQDIDTSEFEKLEQEGKKMQAEIKALCAGGKRDQAQDQAIAYSKEMMALPAMQKMRECSELMRGMLPKMPFDNFEEEFKNKNICDEME
jgi:Skp family chaperone for outer membrane proteins